MQFLVPRYTLTNYQQIISVPYQGSGTEWRDFFAVIQALRSYLIRRFKSVDARRLSTDLQVGPTEKIVVGGTELALYDFVIATKLLLPSLWTCDYFFWNRGDGVHLGIDIMLPRGMPLTSFASGVVSRVKVRDGNPSNEGNCVVIKDLRGYFWCYEHLDRCDVSVGQQIKQGDLIGLCGKTGYATQYHLHLQVDRATTSPHPLWSTSLPVIQQHTIDPLGALRAVSPDAVFRDLPYETREQDPILYLAEHSLIKGYQGQVFPEQGLKRYEMALLFHRVLRYFNRYAQLKKITTSAPVYSDVSWGEPELDEALLRLWQYGLMKGHGHGSTFAPFSMLAGEEILAMVGRAFFSLQDFDGHPWYKTYVEYFVHHQIVHSGWKYLGTSVLRKEVFVVVVDVLKKKGVI